VLTLSGKILVYLYIVKPTKRKAVMKKLKVLLITFILLAAGSFAQQALAQEKTKAEKEKEAQMEQAIAEQKKALAEQKKAQSELDVLKKEQEAASKDLIDAEIETIEGPEVKVFTSRGGRSSVSRSFSGPEPFVFNYSGGDPAFFGHAFGGDEERTTWDFSKSVKESTFSRDYSFDVEKTVNQVVLSINGDCKDGEIRIKIVMPSGKDYSDIVIDEDGNLNWRKSFSISDTENQDKAGEWKFKITSSKATGYFKISLQTF
jgi:hypothetical protein